MGVLVPVGGWDKRIAPVLDHAQCDLLCESLCRHVEVAQNNVAAPPTHKADHVCVDLCHVSTYTMRRAMVPPARIKRALMSSGVNATFGMMIVVTALSAAVILALRTLDHSTPLKIASRCVSGVAPGCCKCATRHYMAATAYAQGVSCCAVSY